MAKFLLGGDTVTVMGIFARTTRRAGGVIRDRFKPWLGQLARVRNKSRATYTRVVIVASWMKAEPGLDKGSRIAKPVRFYDRFSRPVTAHPREPTAINTIVYLAGVHRFICAARHGGKSIGGKETRRNESKSGDIRGHRNKFRF